MVIPPLHLTFPFPWSVCLSVRLLACLCVCLLVSTVSPAITAEPVEVPFRTGTQVDPGNHVSEARIPQRKGQFWENYFLGRPSAMRPFVKII